MFTLLIVVELIISILLILAVLMQSSKGGGLAGTFGGGNVGVVFGVRRTADFLTRATQILAGAFLGAGARDQHLLPAARDRRAAGQCVAAAGAAADDDAAVAAAGSSKRRCSKTGSKKADGSSNAVVIPISAPFAFLRCVTHPWLNW